MNLSNSEIIIILLIAMLLLGGLRLPKLARAWLGETTEPESGESLSLSMIVVLSVVALILAIVPEEMMSGERSLFLLLIDLLFIFALMIYPLANRE